MGRILSIDEIGGIERDNKKIVLAGGSFDLLHVGHVRFLQRCKELGDDLVVALMSDANIRERKGHSRPIMSEQDRAEILSHLGSVDYVFVSANSHLSSTNLGLVLPDIAVYCVESNVTDEKMRARVRFRGELMRDFPETDIVFVTQQSDETSTSALIGSFGEVRGEKYTVKGIVQRLEDLRGKSTCALRQVAAVITADDRIIAEGVNSSMDGRVCSKGDCVRQVLRDTGEYGKGVKLELCRAIHAEQKAIAHAARSGFSTNGASMYCTHMPCVVCAKDIKEAGIHDFYYLEGYSNSDGEQLLLGNGVRVEKLT